MCLGETRAPKAPGSRRLRRVGWSLGRGVPFPADYRIWGSIVSSPSGVRREAPPKKMHFLHILGHITLLVERRMWLWCSMNYWYNNNFLSLSGPRGATAATTPWLRYWVKTIKSNSCEYFFKFLSASCIHCLPNSVFFNLFIRMEPFGAFRLLAEPM